MTVSYRPEVDGLRAVAVIPVVLFHAGAAGMAGGFVGVDVFFVISGFLITSILLADWQGGTFSYRRFYVRRARRILPALLTVTALSVPVAILLLPPPELRDFFRSVVYVSSFTANTYFYQTTGYFQTASELKPLLHTWSLAVEEQFYLLFPVGLMLSLRLGLRGPMGLLGLAGLVSLWAAERASHLDPSAAFYLLPYRFWELALGGGAALWVASAGPRKGSDLCAGLGLGLIAVAIFSYGEDTPFPGLWALPPTVGAAMVLLFTSEQTRLGRVLSRPALVWVGRVSFSLYLWHQPVLAFARAVWGVDLPGVVAGGAVVLAFLLALGTWAWVENPVRRPSGGVLLSNVWTGAVLAGAAMALILIGQFGYVRHGFPRLYATLHLPEGAVDTFVRMDAAARAEQIPTMPDDGACMFWSGAVDAAFEARFDDCASRLGPAVMVLGDSHAMDVYAIGAMSGQTPFLVGLSRGGCRPTHDGGDCPYVAVPAFVAARPGAVALVLFQQTGSFLIADAAGEFDTERPYEPGAVYSISDDAIDAILSYVTGLTQIVPTVWLGPFQESHADLLNPASPIYRGQMRIDPAVIAMFHQVDATARGRAEAAGVRYVSLIDQFAIGPDFLEQDGCITYRDDDHLSACGKAILAARWPAILAASR